MYWFFYFLSRKPQAFLFLVDTKAGLSSRITAEESLGPGHSCYRGLKSPGFPFSQAPTRKEQSHIEATFIQHRRSFIPQVPLSLVTHENQLITRSLPSRKNKYLKKNVYQQTHLFQKHSQSLLMKVEASAKSLSAIKRFSSFLLGCSVRAVLHPLSHRLRLTLVLVLRRIHL